MTTEDIIIHIFYLVDERMKMVKRVPQTHLYPSEIVTIGILFALKGGTFSGFLSLVVSGLCAFVRWIAGSNQLATLAQNPSAAL